MIDHEQQAAAFAAWHRRRGGAWDEALAVWLASKDFAPLDRARIAGLVRADQLAEGAVATDPYVYLGVEGVER